MHYHNSADTDHIVQRLTEVITQALQPKNCVTCLHFQEMQEQCTKYGQRPPARVIATGCKAWAQLPPF